MKTELYNITIYMTSDSDGYGITMDMMGSDSVDELMNQFGDYSEIHDILINDITESVGAYFDNLLVMQGEGVDCGVDNSVKLN